MNSDDAPNLLFSDFFGIDKSLLDKEGLFDISLVADLPLFIDPFLLFNSKKPEYQKLHTEIISYLGFLKNKSISGNINSGLLSSLYKFSEVRQNWLGFSQNGNSGSGLGDDFAKSLNNNFSQIFSNYGEEQITKSAHLEKLCLIKDGVGKDNISDFTTNLIKNYLCALTENFAKKYIDSKLCDSFRVQKAEFVYDTESWADREFFLPRFGNNPDDYVILTPKDMLAKEDTWINRSDLVKEFFALPYSIQNNELRAKLNNYLDRVLSEKPTQKEKGETARNAIWEFPELIDYYIRLKEDRGDRAESISSQRVAFSEDLYLEKFKTLSMLLSKTPFFKLYKTDSYDEALERAQFLKQVIENNDGYRGFYDKNGNCIRREEDLKIFYRMTWFRSDYEFDTEVNNGRGPVDGKVSKGSANKSLVEFKLASNSQLEANLKNQVEIYKKANNANKAIKIIIFFTLDEEKRLAEILNRLGLQGEKSIILIDARNDNKISASKAR